MKRADVEEFEKLIGQLQGLHVELGGLARKTPNAPISPFKLRFVNQVVATANSVLGSRYRPYADLELFDDQDLPTASDVTLLLSQYLQCAETMRADNIEYRYPSWYWRLEDDLENESAIETGPPKKVVRK